MCVKCVEIVLKQTVQIKILVRHIDLCLGVSLKQPCFFYLSCVQKQGPRTTTGAGFAGATAGATPVAGATAGATPVTGATAGATPVTGATAGAKKRKS